MSNFMIDAVLLLLLAYIIQGHCIGLIICLDRRGIWWKLGDTGQLEH